MLAAALFLIAVPTSAYASGANFVATGHDMDYHCSGGTTEECEYLKIVVDKVRSGSTLPILAIDQGTEVERALINAGYTGTGEVVTVSPLETTTFNSTAFVDSSNHPLYSAIITASDSTCGGCDDTPEGETNINARAADFATYFNHGGGILALAGAENYETYLQLRSSVRGCDRREPTLHSDPRRRSHRHQHPDGELLRHAQQLHHPILSAGRPRGRQRRKGRDDRRVQLGDRRRRVQNREN